MSIGARSRGGTTAPPLAGPLRLASLAMIADQDFLALARTTAMHVGALLSLPLTRIADLRLAVDEACACFLDPAGHRAANAWNSAVQAAPEVLELTYDRYPGELRVAVRGRVEEGWPRVDELGWALLGSLVGAVNVQAGDGFGTLTLAVPLPPEPH